MLRTLEIRDLLIIDRLELEFQPGLNVLTGETGAGKSILLDSLGFVLGWRGRAELVRSGAEQGEVVAVFDLPAGHPARAVLVEAGFDDADEWILRRVNTVDGRKTGWINDRRVSGELLRTVSDVLVELHGQHDDRGLLNPKGHRALLDEFAGHGPLMDKVRAAWATMSKARQAVTSAEAALAAAQEEEDFLRHSVAELDTLAPVAGEDVALDASRRMMQASERIREDIVRAAQVLGQDGVENAMSDAMRWLEGVSDAAEGQLDDALAALSRAMVELDYAARGIAGCLNALEFDPHELEATEERLFALRALARKHSVAPDDLADLADHLRDRLTGLDQGADRLAELRGSLTVAERDYNDVASALRDSRMTAARRLDLAVCEELAPLKMERALFVTDVTEAPAGPAGIDAVAFTVATNPGAPAGPIGKIASGGELSRFLLALKVCLSERRDAGLTMIFDEIDRGVGGATADAVGRRLASLADGGQVLVVTHSPQVAALGAHHWRVEKQVADAQTTSTVVPLDASSREGEIARMLSGDTITDEARAAARALLAG